jgi:DNA-binding transcriptional LysR family regulator
MHVRRGLDLEIPIHLLPVFLELAESLNISRTAKKLRISQPAVSRQLQSLEQNLGVTLFLRQSRGMSLTLSGKQLKSQIQEPFDSMCEHLIRLRKETASISGTIVFGSLTEIGKRLFMPLLLEFAGQHKGISLDVRLMSERFIPQGLIEGQLGLGLLTSRPKEDSLKVHHLFSERIVVLTSAKNKIDLEQNKSPQFVANSSQDLLLQTSFRKLFQRTQTLKPDIIVSVNDHQSMLHAVEKMSLYAVMPILSAQELLDSGKLRLASKKELKNEIYLAVRKNQFLEKKYQEVIHFLVEKTKAMER